jgi:anhydro-N-acetylmuramic acid kinase
MTEASFRLAACLGKSSRRLIGLMSGMSMDGVDLAYATVSGNFPDLQVVLEGTDFRPYGKEVRQRLLSSADACAEEISQLNFLVASEFSACVQSFLKKKKIPASAVDAIGSHGQTVAHSSRSSGVERSSASLQIGSPSIIAALTGIITIGNFRVRDIALGGQGAPLVSLADYVLFRDPSQTIALHNLGSISNLTVVTPDPAEMFAFDTGPANMAIDFYARRLGADSEGIDRDGAFSSKGRVIEPLLARMLSAEFFRLIPPKAAGFAEFGPVWLGEISKAFEKENQFDLIRTAVEFAAVTLADAYTQFVIPKCPTLQRLLFSGGGVYNRTLMGRIKELLPMFRIEIVDPEMADAKEALAFAILANETLSGRTGSLTGVTGARVAAILGEIAI